MSRKPDIDPPARIEITIPTSWRVKLELLLFSPLEKKVPKGKFRDFWLERLTDYFNTQSLDLTPYGFAPGFYVRGPKEMIEALERKLKNG